MCLWLVYVIGWFSLGLILEKLLFLSLAFFVLCCFLKFNCFMELNHKIRYFMIACTPMLNLAFWLLLTAGLACWDLEFLIPGYVSLAFIVCQSYTNTTARSCSSSCVVVEFTCNAPYNTTFYLLLCRMIWLSFRRRKMRKR